LLAKALLQRRYRIVHRHVGVPLGQQFVFARAGVQRRVADLPPKPIGIVRAEGSLKPERQRKLPIRRQYAIKSIDDLPKEETVFEPISP